MQANNSNRPKEMLCDAHPQAGSIKQALEKVVGSPAFKATPRRKKLLRYLVEELLAGRARELKGYSIATLVFGRDDTFDPQTDPVVRLEARRLRHDLDGYYATEGRTDPLRINIPKGQYAPAIEWAGEEPDLHAEPPAPDMDARIIDLPANTVAWKRVRFGRPALAVLACLLLFLGIIAYGLLNPGTLVADRRNETAGTSLAVLAFAADGDNSKNALLAKSMADEIMTTVNQSGDVRLYLPSSKEQSLSSDDPIEIGKSLALSYVVNGSIELDAGDKMLRVTARLIDVRTQRIVWIGSYDRDYSASALRAVQHEIGSSILSALGQP